MPVPVPEVLRERERRLEEYLAARRDRPAVDPVMAMILQAANQSGMSPTTSGVSPQTLQDALGVDAPTETGPATLGERLGALGSWAGNAILGRGGVGSPKVPEVPEGLAAFREKWTGQGVRNFVTEGEDTIKLHDLFVPKEARKAGVGSAFMQELVDYADQQGKRVILTAARDYGATSVGRLKEFYKRFGFVENKGRRKDFTISDNMYREPPAKTGLP